MTRLGCLLLVVACGSSTRTAREPWVPEEEKVGDLPRFDSTQEAQDARDGVLRGRVVKLTDGRFLADFPGAPIGVEVMALPASAIASEQYTSPGDVIREGPWHFSAIGSHVDHDRIHYLALVPAMPPQEERRDANSKILEQPLWFTLAAAQPEKPWRLWQERDGNTSLLAIDKVGGTGDIAAVRVESEVQRVRALSIDPTVPMLYVERGGSLEDGDEIADANAVVKYEIYAYRSGTVERRLTFPAERTAIVIDKNVVQVFVLPDQTTCPPAELLSAGCVVERTDHVWSGSLFATAEVKRVTMRLVDLKR